MTVHDNLEFAKRKIIGNIYMSANLECKRIIFKTNGLGIINIPIEKKGDFLNMLVHYYETNKVHELKQFIFDKCIDGLKKD